MKDGPLYGRYTITHKDGKPIDPTKRYFVLSPDSDPHARNALAIYAELCEETHPELAKSIRDHFGIETSDDLMRDLMDDYGGPGAVEWIQPHAFVDNGECINLDFRTKAGKKSLNVNAPFAGLVCYAVDNEDGVKITRVAFEEGYRWLTDEVDVIAEGGE